MNEISFTGIHNIRIRKKYNTVWGPYLHPGHAQIISDKIPLRQGEKHYKQVIIDCDVTDDALGKDFTEYIKQLKKASPEPDTEIPCINPQNQNHIQIVMNRFDANDDLGHVTESNFRLNDNDIPLNNRSTLPFYTLMASITRKLQALESVSEKQLEFITLVNESIHQKAVNFIENIM